MINGSRRWMLAATYAIGMLVLLVGLGSMLYSGNGLQTEEQIVAGIGIAFVSFALVQQFDRSLWEVLPPPLARLLGIYVDRDEHRTPPKGG